MCRVIAIANQKGGVGKSTTTSNLGIGLVNEGKKVLLIDSDAQGSLTASLGYKEPDALEITLATVMANIINDVDIPVDFGIIQHEEGIDILPGNIELSGLEVSLVNVMSRERVMQQYIEKVRDRYDYILIDCMKNNWHDDENRAYIYYTMENIMEDLGCAKEKCAKVLAELDSKKGYGLIEKKRQGLGKPDIIYVMNFATIENDHTNDNKKEPVNANNTAEVRKSNFKKFENQTSVSSEIKPQEVRESNLSKFENQTSVSSENEPQEVRKANANYTDTNYTDLNYTNPIYPSGEFETRSSQDTIID